MRSAPDSIQAHVKFGGSETILNRSHVLVATGRIPNVDGLGLEAASIACEPNGIRVDRGLRTTNRRVYAIGDVVGGPGFTHLANHHSGPVIRNALFRLPMRMRYKEIRWVIFTDPELAHVGLTDEEAKQQEYDIRVLRWPFRENDRAQARHGMRGRAHGHMVLGHVKVITSKRGRILGATIVGPHAGDLIAPWTLAIRHGLNIRVMAEAVSPYPTLGEVNKRAAMTYFPSSLANPGVRRVIRWLRHLG